MTTFEGGLLDAQVMLKKFALFLVRNEDEANDAVQETICRALVNRDQFEAGTNLDAWLVTILRNYVRSTKRKGWRRGDATTAEGPRVLFTDNNHYADHLPAPGNPEKDLIDKETFIDTVCRLPEAWYDVTVRAGLGFSQKELSRTLGVPQGTVKSRLHRARMHLAKEAA